MGNPALRACPHLLQKFLVQLQLLQLIGAKPAQAIAPSTVILEVWLGRIFILTAPLPQSFILPATRGPTHITSGRDDSLDNLAGAGIKNGTQLFKGRSRRSIITMLPKSTLNKTMPMVHVEPKP